MRKFYLYILIVLPVWAFSGCNDFLDVPAEGQISSGNIWQNPKLIRASLAGLYDDIQYENFTYFLEWDVYNMYLSTVTDDCIGSYQAGPLGNNDAGAVIYDGEWFGWWGYSAIRDCNVFLEKLKGADIELEDKERLEADVLFIRSFHYFNLVKRYGGVPLILAVQQFSGDNLDELQVARNTEKQIWDFIGQELDFCSVYLPSFYDENNVNRATRWAALGLKSRAMLYAASIAKYGEVKLNALVGVESQYADGYWQKSLEASNEILNDGPYRLYNQYADKSENYYRLFLDESNQEYIFWEAFSVPEKAHSYDLLFTPFSFRQNGYGCGWSPTIEFVEAFAYLDGSDGVLKLRNEQGAPREYDSPIDLFEGKDPRLKGTLYLPMSQCRGGIVEIRRGIYDDGEYIHYDDMNQTYGDGDEVMYVVGKDGIIDVDDPTKTGFYVKKFYNEELENIQGEQSEQNWPVFRLAEMYLNAAEAAFELDDPSLAKDYLNPVRERAGIRLLEEEDITLSGIRNERRVELSFENHRYWDLRRWRIADEVLDFFRTKALYPWFNWQTKNYFFTIGDAPKAIKVFQERHYYMKFSDEEMNTNPNMVQNPGY
jgi:hypothetical protein